MRGPHDDPGLAIPFVAPRLRLDSVVVFGGVATAWLVWTSLGLRALGRSRVRVTATALEYDDGRSIRRIEGGHFRVAYRMLGATVVEADDGRAPLLIPPCYENSTEMWGAIRHLASQRPTS